MRCFICSSVKFSVRQAIVWCWYRNRAMIESDKGIELFYFYSLVNPHICISIIAPHFCAFATVGANINVPAALQNAAAEIHILIIVPYFFKWLSFQVAQLVLCILIKAAWHNQSIP